MIRSCPWYLALAVLLPTALVAQDRPEPSVPPADMTPEAAVGTITGADLHHRIGVLAHDSMRGRDTPSPELDGAAAWIASEFARMGLRPGGEDGGFLQRYSVRVLASDLAGSTLTSTSGARAEFGVDVLPVPWSSLADASATGPAVLVVGQPAPDAMEGFDLDGRVVVYLGHPAGAATVARASATGNAAAVIFAADESDRSWNRRVERAAARTATVVGSGPGDAPTLHVRDGALGRLLGLDLRPLRSRAGDGPSVRELPGVSLTLEQATRAVSEASAPNVVGILPGRDPSLREEYVVFSAHLDHIGVGAPNAEGDSIYNGADDNASGTATVMEVAEAMASLDAPPRRSMVFLLVSGEEKGLWGSEWFARNPTVPLDRMVANLNADMVGRNWPDTIVAIGRHHSDLGETLSRVNEAHPELGMTAIDDLWPEQNFYRRSDHFNFARRGVPVLFFFNGTHPDYHGLDDELEAIDTEKAARIGRLLFWLALEIGNADERPAWNPESRRAIVDRAPGGADGGP